MGNHRFKLSHMMPNAWFYKLRDMNRTTPDHQTSKNNSFPSSKNSTHRCRPASTSLDSLPPHDLNTRKSYYFPRDLSPRIPNPPRRSSEPARPPRKSKPRPAALSALTDSVWTRIEDAGSPDSIFDSSSPEFRLDRVLTRESLSSYSSRVDPIIDVPDIVICVDENSVARKPKGASGSHSLDSSPRFELPRIITKPAKPKHNHNTDRIEAGDGETKKSARKARECGSCRKSVSRRCSVSSTPRLRLKIKSPRVPTLSRRPAQARRTGTGTGPGGKFSGCLAIVKSSSDPHMDFRESMVEMIVEHNIKASKDLEELLACYLSLNSDEYHELIVKVFKQIWFDLIDISSLQVG